MKVLVTGDKGFIGKNLISRLGKINNLEIYGFNSDSDFSLLEKYTQNCDFVFHLAGVNRPNNPEDYMEGNFGFTSKLLNSLKKHNNLCPIMFASSIQALNETPYGRSKKAAEDLIRKFGKETGTSVLIYRFPNVFGKWCRPNYNSVIATFCHNIANDLPIKVNDPNTELNLVYIDDLVEELVNALCDKPTTEGDFCIVPVSYNIKLGEIVDLLYSFKKSREELSIPLTNGFVKKLYATYLSYLPKNQFSYPLKMNIDNRGSFTEFIRTSDRGQVSINVTKPGIVRGNHWHHTKVEKFLVVSGKGVVRFRNIHSKEIIEYFVSGDKLEVIDIPVGYTHNIENIGDTDLVTIIWANESFDPQKPDTYFQEV